MLELAYLAFLAAFFAFLPALVWMPCSLMAIPANSMMSETTPAPIVRAWPDGVGQ
ncbi:hypothetical protein D3C72_2591160 [compost metagenome]